MIHAIQRTLCSTCGALMAALVKGDEIAYRCVNKHELHPPARFRDSANGE